MALLCPQNLPSQSKLDSVEIDAKRCPHQVNTKTGAGQTQFVQADVVAFYLR